MIKSNSFLDSLSVDGRNRSILSGAEDKPTEVNTPVITDKGINDAPKFSTNEPVEGTLPVVDKGIDGTDKPAEEVQTTPVIGDEVKKEESKTEAQPELSYTPIVSKLVELGALTEEEVTEKDFEDSEDGIVEVVKHMSDKQANEKYLEKINSLTPEAKRLLELAEEGVDLKKLYEVEEEEIDFNLIDLEDISNQQQLYYDYLIATGVSHDKAEKAVTMASDNGTLTDYAEISIDHLSNAQEKRKESLITSQKEAAKQAKIKQEEDYNKFVKDITETKAIKGFELSKNDVAKMLDYMTKPVDKSGKTAEQLAWEDVETRKLFAYLTMKKFDLKSLETQIATKKTIELKKKVDNHSDKGLSNKGIKTQETKQKVQAEIPSLSFLLG